MATKIEKNLLSNIWMPSSSDTKSSTGKLLIIGGSSIFHGAILLSLKAASRICGIVYLSVPKDFSNFLPFVKSQISSFISVSFEDIEKYILDTDVCLIGPGFLRQDQYKGYNDESNYSKNLAQNLLTKYKEKKWVIDAGTLQVLEPSNFPTNSIITPNNFEYKVIFKKDLDNLPMEEKFAEIEKRALEHSLTIFYKNRDLNIISDGKKTFFLEGSIPGLKKGGFGDICSGIVASMYCKNDSLTSCIAASYLIKVAGDELQNERNFMFSADDLCDHIPFVFKKVLYL